MNGIAFFRHVRAVLGGGRLLVLLVATVVFTTLAGAAFGYWGTTGSGTGSASTGTLNQPTGVMVSSAAGSGSVSVNWIAPSGTPSAQSYFVTRTGNGTSTVACPTSGSTLKATSCTDSSVSDGTYTYTVTAVYNSWTATSDPSASVAVTNTIATTTTLKSSSTLSSVVGQQVTYTATVAAASGSATPTGFVTFTDKTNTIGCDNQPLTGGSATCSVTYTSTGSHSITAAYGGGTGLSGSSSSALNQTVNKAGTTTSVSSSGTASVGQAVTFTATVSAVSPGAGTPTGTVAFAADGTALTCAGGPQTLNTTGTVTCQVTFDSAGSKSVTATYAGDTNYATSTSPEVFQTVTAPAMDTTPPAVKVTYPSATIAINNGQWTQNNCANSSGAAGLCGTGADNAGGSGFAAGVRAQYELRQIGTTATCWNGSTFSAAACGSYQTASGTQGSWFIAVPYASLPTKANFELRVKLVDVAGNSNRPGTVPAGTPDITFAN